MNTGKFHSQEILDKIKQLWCDGRTGREIGDALNLSRHSVRHIAHRLNLPAKRAGARYRTVTRVAPRPLPKAKVDTGPAPIGPIGDFPPPGTCRFIAGDTGADFQCCGHPGYPFCDHHAKRVYLPSKLGGGTRNHNQ